MLSEVTLRTRGCTPHYYHKPDQYFSQHHERCDPNTSRLSAFHITQTPNNTARYPDEHDHAQHGKSRVCYAHCRPRLIELV